MDATPSDVKVVFMRQGRRYGLSAEQRTDIWRRWKAGESLHEIGRAFGKDHGSIQFLLSQHGGIAPAVRRRSQQTLTLAERKSLVVARRPSIGEVQNERSIGGAISRPLSVSILGDCNLTAQTYTPDRHIAPGLVLLRNNALTHTA